MRILIVEDEKRLADTIRDLLSSNGYTADVSYDGEDGYDNAMSGIYDAVILDVMLPKMDGFEIVKGLREQGSAVPVLMLTARSAISDKVNGLDCGADYYLTKPFENAELLACVRSLMRRQSEYVGSILTFGDVELDTTRCILSCAGQEVRLSSKEFEIMHLLVHNGKHIISKETILLKAWGYDSDAEDNHVEVYISFLRKKLQHIKSRVSIETVRRVGYHLEEKEDG